MDARFLKIKKQPDSNVILQSPEILAVRRKLWFTSLPFLVMEIIADFLSSAAFANHA